MTGEKNHYFDQRGQYRYGKKIVEYYFFFRISIVLFGLQTAEKITLKLFIRLSLRLHTQVQK
jgi:hypothetical protein